MSNRKSATLPKRKSTLTHDPRMAFRDQTYNGDTIRLDGRLFEHCTFRNCTIEISGTERINLVGCSFDQCQWVVVGAALMTLQILGALYQDPGMQSFVEATFENIRQLGKTPEPIQVMPTGKFDA